MTNTQILKYNLTWGPKVVPEDVRDIFEAPAHPWKAHFWSPWVWTEDGPVLELSTPLAVTWENLESDLYGLLEFGAVGEVLIVDLDSHYLIVKLVLGETIIATALTVEGARAATTKEIHFPT